MCIRDRYGRKTVTYKKRGNKNYLQAIWDMIDEADAVIHYNGKKFDMKHLNREFVEAGMAPPHQPKDIDLLTTVRSRFAFPSNKLDYVAGKLLGEYKVQHAGMELWTQCIANNRDAWKVMKEYNIQDVELTEKLYEKLRGWIKNHPNHGLFVADQTDPVCRNCGSRHVVSKGPEYDYTNVFSYQRYKCVDCGANLRGRKRIITGSGEHIVL